MGPTLARATDGGQLLGRRRRKPVATSSVTLRG
jgi:hypothetical protein